MRRLIDDFWNRANTSAGTVGNGWTDQVGTVFSVNSNRLETTPSAGNSSYAKDSLTRPASENCLDQRQVLISSANNTSTTVMAGKLRWSAGNSSGDNGYLVFLQYSDSSLNLYSLVDGAPNQIATTTVSPSVSPSHQYAIDFSATGSSPTTLNITVTDWYSGSVVGSLTAATDSTAGLQVSAGFAVVAQSATCFYDEVKTYNLGANQFIGLGLGDSIMDGYEVSPPADPYSQFLLALAKTQSYDGVTGTNQAVGGTTSTDWVNGTNGASLPTAIAAAQAIGATVADIMLGTNDAKLTVMTSAATYRSNLATIASTLLAPGTGIQAVRIHYPTYILPGSSSGSWNTTSNALLLAYQPEIDSLVNGTTILQGDRNAFAYFAANWSTELTPSGPHPNATGDISLGVFWAAAVTNQAAAIAAVQSTANTIATQTTSNAQQTNATAAMTTQGLTTVRAAKLDALDAAISSRSAPGTAQTITPADSSGATAAQGQVATIATQTAPLASGTAVAGGAMTITLAAGGNFAGQLIRISSGTGAGQVRTIAAMSGAVATIDFAWNVVPDNTSRYVLPGMNPATITIVVSQD